MAAVEVEVEALLWDRQSTARITTGSAHNGQDRTSAKTVGEIKTACGTRSFIVVPLYECITKHLLQLPYVVHRFTAYMLWAKANRETQLSSCQHASYCGRYS